MIQRLPHSAFWGESGERWGKLGWESGGGFGEVLGKIWGPILFLRTSSGSPILSHSKLGIDFGAQFDFFGTSSGPPISVLDGFGAPFYFFGLLRDPQF